MTNSENYALITFLEMLSKYPSKSLTNLFFIFIIIIERQTAFLSGANLGQWGKFGTVNNSPLGTFLKLGNN